MVNTSPPATILLLAAESASLAMAEAVLGELGAAVVRVGSGAEAAKKLAESEFALIVIDDDAQATSGLEAIRPIRAQLRSRSTPIVVMSDRSERIAARVYADGAADVLAKPLDAIALTAKATLFVELYRSRQQALAEQGRALESELSAQQHLWQSMLARLGEAVIASDADGRVVYLNREAERLTGWAAAEAFGRDLGEVFDRLDRGGDLLPRCLLDPALRADDVACLGKHTVLVGRHGCARLVHGYVAPIRDESGKRRAVMLVFHDAGERDEAAQRLREDYAELEARVAARTAELAQERAFLAAVLEEVEDGIVACNPEGVLTLFNRASRAFHGLSEAPLPPEAWAEYYSLFRSDGVTPLPSQEIPLLRALRGESVRDAEMVIAPQHGRARLIRASGQPLYDDAGHPLGAVVSMHDISSQREAQAARERAVRERLRREAAEASAEQMRESEEQLRASEARVRLATEAAGLGVWVWYPETDQVFWESERLYDLFGVDPAAGPVNATAFAAEFIHKDDVAAFEQALAAAIETGARLHWVGRFFRQNDGELRWAEFTAHVQVDEKGTPSRLLGTASDITERKQAEARAQRAAAEAVAAAEANAKFRAFFEQGAYFAGVMTLDGTLVEANRLSLEGCGYTREEVIGRKFWEGGWWRPSPALVDMIREASREAAAGRSFRRETTYFRADGSERSVDLILAPVTDDDGRVLFIAPSGIDITDRKQAEADLRRLAAELAEANQRKTEFLATLAHELRNPLAPLRNGLEVMRLAAGNASAVRKARDMMERQLAHMVHLVDDLLDIARITRGKVDLKTERVSLQSIVGSAVETSLPLIEAGLHALSVDLPDETLLLDVDPNRLAQVLSNLLNNAAKYTPSGGRIRIAGCREGGQVAISVSDTGMGIPAESLSSVFDMFSQVGRNMERAQGGLGIGLTLVRRLVEMHGGSVTADSSGAGQGSIFTVRLPLAVASESEIAPPAQPVDAGAEPASGLRVLVVDDNRDAAESLSLLLQLSGHATRVAHGGEQALNIARDFRPELAFVDIGMPRMDGYELARQLRRLPQTDDLMLVAVTGWGTEEDRMRTQAAGFDDHLTKPAALSAVNELLAKRLFGPGAPPGSPSVPDERRP